MSKNSQPSRSPESRKARRIIRTVRRVSIMLAAATEKQDVEALTVRLEKLDAQLDAALAKIPVRSRKSDAPVKKSAKKSATPAPVEKPAITPMQAKLRAANPSPEPQTVRNVAELNAIVRSAKKTTRRAKAA